MAAQTFPNYSRDVRHGKSGSGSSLNYGPVPGSPTLTNPDMILPDYDCDVSLDERSQSPIRMWNNVQSSDMRFHLPSSQNQFIAGPITPSTPIIYGNGTMLSDIGEVTEVESVVGKGGRRGSAHLSVYSNDDHVLGSSPTMGITRIKSRSQILQRERKSSIDSNSTITSQGRAAPFGDFDDSVSVDDLNFQGDDEESMASSYVEGTAVREPKIPRIARTQEATEQRYSTNDGGQPVKGKKLFIYSDVRRVNPFSANRSTCNVLKRVYHPSEFDPGFPQRSASALGAAGGYRQPLTSSRSADALGIGYGATSHRSPTTLDPMLETLSEDEGGANGDSRRSSHLYNQLSPTFGSMTDTDMPRSASVAQVRDLKHQMKDLRGKISSLKEQARADSLKRRSLQSLRTPSPFTHARWDQGLPESRTSQETTPETPAWQAPWNQGSPKEKVNGQISPKEGSKEPSEESAKTLDAGAVHGPRTSDAPDVVVAQEQSGSPQFEAEPDLGDDIQVQTQVQENDDMNDDGETWEGDLEQEEDDFKREGNGYGLQNGEYNDDAEDDDDDEFVDFESESGESSYHDAFQTPVSHEDREDAFDYEHFFLHSAMGTMSQHRRESWSSVSSGDSVETTRGPIVAPTSAPDSDSDHERRPSVDTMSSFNSFATANEGRLSRNSEFEDAAESIVVMPADSDVPPSSKRATFGNFKFPRSGAPSRNGSVDYHQSHPRRNTVVRRPSSSAATYARHRPSMSSFGSTGTNRSFPLVDKSKGTNGILTPTGTPGGSPDSELRQISESLLNEAAGLGGIEGGQRNGNTSAVQGLDKESQILVERLVASLGKCVLGLTESSRAGTEARMYRRRIDAARRILEGLEE
ncbi:uncharacterized protein FSUBG_8186 [Fusarium subglutinans]|uniref:Uncharacterized protein n=1 Tax=Gibberella subglutinans TaxID=42677 RepID=A0A8H5PQH0_GIBSU|nr:uncharacterized protein FSUBG_8186 [Fusarium subglutinans]KAF5601480.1 hypothetical protein FSUBG_8186 [Fusarium subglutinans]